MGFNWPWEAKEVNIADDDWGAVIDAEWYQLEPLPRVSPHWPGIGQYIGAVSDDCREDRFPWQRARFYKDEIGALANFICKESYYVIPANRFCQIRGFNWNNMTATCGQYCNFLSDSKTVVNWLDQEIPMKYISDNFAHHDVSRKYGAYNHKLFGMEPLGVCKKKFRGFESYKETINGGTNA